MDEMDQRGQSVMISVNQCQSVSISVNQWQSVAIGGTQGLETLATD